MSRWSTRFADAAERLPTHVAYAELLTCDRDAARELAHGALVKVTGRFRIPRDPADVDQDVRDIILERYLKQLPPAATTAPDAALTPSSDAPRSFAESTSPFAPPTPGVHRDDPYAAQRRDDSERVTTDRFGDALAALDPRTRVATVLYFHDGLGLADIASAVGTPEPAVRTMLESSAATVGPLVGMSEAPDFEAEQRGDSVDITVRGRERGRR